MINWTLYWLSVHAGNLAYATLNCRPRAVRVAEFFNDAYTNAWYLTAEGREHTARYGR